MPDIITSSTQKVNENEKVQFNRLVNAIIVCLMIVQLLFIHFDYFFSRLKCEDFVFGRSRENDNKATLKRVSSLEGTSRNKNSNGKTSVTFYTRGVEDFFSTEGKT